MQVLADAAAIDARAAAGQDITPLCGMPLVIKAAVGMHTQNVVLQTQCCKPNYHCAPVAFIKR